MQLARQPAPLLLLRGDDDLGEASLLVFRDFASGDVADDAHDTDRSGGRLGVQRRKRDRDRHDRPVGGAKHHVSARAARRALSAHRVEARDVRSRHEPLEGRIPHEGQGCAHDFGKTTVAVGHHAVGRQRDRTFVHLIGEDSVGDLGGAAHGVTIMRRKA